MKWTLLALLACLATTTQAAVYRWVDANGDLQYGDKPPGGVVVEAG